MTDSAARLHANWVFFAVVYFLVVTAFALSVIGLQTFNEVTGSALTIPVGADLALPVIAFLLAVFLAGMRYADAHPEWGGRDRHHLALIYSATSLFVAAVVGGAMFVFLAFMIGGFDQMSAALTDWRFVAFVAFGFTVYMAVSYPLSRLLLWLIARRGQSRVEQPS